MTFRIQFIGFLFALVLCSVWIPSACQAQSQCSGDAAGSCAVPTIAVPISAWHPVGARYGYVAHRYPYDYRHGVADIIRSTALANAINAQARTQHLHADRLQMENSVEYLATRLQRKQINRESRFGHLHERGARVAAAKLAAARVAGPQVAQHRVDPVTGRVAWPMLLRSSYFDKARAPIDLVFHQRSESGSINPDHFLPMRDWIERIECELKANVAYYEMQDYLEAKDFLRGLMDEARHDLSPTEMGLSVASR